MSSTYDWDEMMKMMIGKIGTRKMSGGKKMIQMMMTRTTQ